MKESADADGNDKTDEQLNAADVERDGDIDIFDAMKLFKFVKE